MRQVFFLFLVVILFAATVGVSLASLPPGGSFIDDDGNIHEPNIEAIAADGITKGCNPPTNDRYCPSDQVTRGQMAAFLTRALNLTNRGDNPFIDDDGSVFEADIERLAAAGITKGCNPPTNDQFCPDAFVSRGQMAAFLVRALGYTDAGAGNLFTDVHGSVFEADIDQLATAGVTKGCNPPTNDRYCPDSPVLRDQMASFLSRALGLSPITPPPPTDTTTTTISSTTTTLPATDHPQSGPGWEFVDCSNPVGTCAYHQDAPQAELMIDDSLLPPSVCIRYGLYGCEQWQTVWSVFWYTPDDAVLGSFCSVLYDPSTGLVAGTICSTPIDGAPVGEYRAELARTYPPLETIQDFYYNVIP